MTIVATRNTGRARVELALSGAQGRLELNTAVPHQQAWAQTRYAVAVWVCQNELGLSEARAINAACLAVVWCAQLTELGAEELNWNVADLVCDGGAQVCAVASGADVRAFDSLVEGVRGFWARVREEDPAGAIMDAFGAGELGALVMLSDRGLARVDGQALGRLLENVRRLIAGGDPLALSLLPRAPGGGAVRRKRGGAAMVALGALAAWAWSK